MSKSINKPVMEIGEAVEQYIYSLEPCQANEVNRILAVFINWFGKGRLLNSLTPSDIARYCQKYPSSDPELERKLETVRSFMGYTRQAGWTRANLAIHVKHRKTRNNHVLQKPAREPVYLTTEGYDAIKAELEILVNRKPSILQAIRTAAADKDFRENSPLAAAKEELGHVEGRIQELEETLKLAKITNNNGHGHKTIGLGDCVVLKDSASGEMLSYTIVSTRESNPMQGRISDSSPLGKALVGKNCGESVTVCVPAGKMNYYIESVNK